MSSTHSMDMDDLEDGDINTPNSGPVAPTIPVSGTLNAAFRLVATLTEDE